MVISGCTCCYIGLIGKILERGWNDSSYFFGFFHFVSLSSPMIDAVIGSPKRREEAKVATKEAIDAP